MRALSKNCRGCGVCEQRYPTRALTLVRDAPGNFVDCAVADSANAAHLLGALWPMERLQKPL
jgi:MinD superfamily P-loop ATPase